MTIEQPPGDDTPPPTPNDDGPGAHTGEPEVRAPGPDASPVGAPRDEPDPQSA
jgi:hypothetical protein